MGEAPFDLHRSRSVSEILRDTLALYRRYPLLFVVLAGGVIAPYEIVVLATTHRGPFTTGGSVGGLDLLFSLLNIVLVLPLVSALHIHAVVQAGEGDAPRIITVGARGMRALPVVVAAVIVADLGIMAGFVCFVVPGVIFALRWAVAAQVAAVERIDWMSSLSRSRQLTRGNYSHIVGLFFVTSAIGGAVNLGALTLPLGSSTGAASVLVGIASHTIVVSFSALTYALLYFDLRARQADEQVEPAPVVP